MRKLTSIVLALCLLSVPSAFAYDKIEWSKMDKNKDGYISPKEMKDHYTKEGVYK